MVSAMGSGGSILRLNKYQDRLLMMLSGHSGEWVMPKRIALVAEDLVKH